VTTASQLHSETRRRAGIDGLLLRWEADAHVLRTRGASGFANVLESCRSDLQAVLTSRANELVTLTVAAAESGYSRDHLSRLARSGALPNRGRHGKPLFRLGELPSKPKNLQPGVNHLHLIGATPRQIARAIVTSQEGR
jgi:hypothetical protein